MHFSSHPHVPHACPITLLLILIPRKILDEDTFRSSSLCSSFQAPLNSTPLRPNNISQPICSSCNTRHQVLHLCKTTDKIMVLNSFRQHVERYKSLGWMWKKFARRTDWHDKANSQFYKFGNAPKTCLNRASSTEKKSGWGVVEIQPKKYFVASENLRTVQKDTLKTREITQKTRWAKLIFR